MRRAAFFNSLRRSQFALSLILGVLTPNSSLAAPAAGAMGMNTFVNTWYTVDLMKTGAFGPVDTNPLAFDDQGWPSTDCQAQFIESGHIDGIKNQVNADISGVYHLSFQCSNPAVTVAPSPDGVPFTIGGQRYDVAAQTWTGALTVDSRIGLLSLRFTNTRGGVRHLKLIRPGFPTDTDRLLTPQFLAMMAPFKGAFRPQPDHGYGVRPFPAVHEW